MHFDWTICTDQLPTESDGTVLVLFSDGTLNTGRYSEHSRRWYIGDMCGAGGTDPVAWIRFGDVPKPWLDSEAIPWFWQRMERYGEIYRDPDGRCWYEGYCGMPKCQADPETCGRFEAYYDGECDADEALEREEQE